MGKRLASADWHGAQWAWDVVKERLGPDDMLYYLGDATDRGHGLNGDGGWSMLKEMLAHPQVCYIMGNHDLMLADALTYPNDSRSVNLCYMNGGGPTLMAADADPEAKKIVAKIRALPRFTDLVNENGKHIFMSHSGSYDLDDEESLIWDRTWYIAEQNWSDYDYIIHGHTGAKHIERDLAQLVETWDLKRSVIEYTGGAYWHNSFACDIDMTTISSSQIVLLDLDTFEETLISMPRAVTEDN